MPRFFLFANARMMTMFNHVKERLEAQVVLQHFLGASRRHTWTCPFHPDKTPSLSAHGPAIRCFGCQWGGDIFRFVEDHLNVSRGEALRILADMAGILLPERNQSKRNRKSPPLPSLQESMVQVQRETRKILGDMLTTTRKCAADASRRAWSMRDSEALWEMIETAAVLDRHTAIVEMQLSHE